MKSKTIKISIAVILIVIVAVGAYLVSSIILFQRIINYGSVLADEQCLKVNPIIIKQKNHVISSLEAAKNEDGEKYISELDNYFAESENYIREQTAWLEAEKAHMNRWDFKYFVPDYMQEAAQLQYDERSARNEYTKLMLEAYRIGNDNPQLTDQITQQAMEYLEIETQKAEQYNKLFDYPPKANWIQKYTKVPESRCPAENFDIPDVAGYMESQL